MEEDEKLIYSKKNIIKVIFSFLLIICIIFAFTYYLINDEFRSTIDANVFGKKIEENLLKTIEIDNDSNPYIYAFNKYITVLSKNVLTFYNQDGNKVESIDVNITTPYVTSNDKYFVLAEDSGQKLYFISDLGIRWNKDLDGEIHRVSVNKNGYVSVILKNTTYKSVIVVYDYAGNELFRTYLANSYAICSEISDNNKYLAVGQIDYSGTIVKSVVKMISIEEAKEKPQESILYTYESESSKILNNIKFNSKNEAICMFDSYIQKVTASDDEKLYEVTENDIFLDINSGNDIVVVQKENTGLFSYDYEMHIQSTLGKSDKLYILENDIPKEIKTTKDYICIKLINEVRIVSSGGWLKKQYTTNSEIQDIVASDNIIGIVYNNKIEIISL